MFLLLLHTSLTLSVQEGATESGGGETEGGRAEEEVWGKGETDPQSAREPEGTAITAAAASEWQNDVLYVAIILKISMCS